MPPRFLLPVLHFAQLRARAAFTRQFDTGLAALLLVGLVVAIVPLRTRDTERMQAAARHLGPQAVAGLEALEPLLNAAAQLDDAGKLAAVNTFFNRRIRFRDDSEVWGEADHWASPLELLAKGEGDCEDFAIAKYFSLLALGMPGSQLRLMHVQAALAGPPPRQQAHMVLAHYAAPGAEPSILDNLVPEVLPAGRRGDLTPVFSFNLDGLWQGTGTEPAGDAATRLPRWRETMAKARAEGFLQ